MVNEDMNIYMVDMDGEWRYKYLHGGHGGGWRYLNIYK